MRQTYSRSEESEKILGIIFDPNITWKNHINYLRQKGFKYLNAIKALSSPKIGTRSDHLLNIINATIRSIFDYGSQLFSFSSNSNRQKLEPIYNAALRLALGLPRNTPLDLLRAESMNGSINTRHNFLCQKFITKQIALKDWSPNARYALVEVKKRGADKEVTGSFRPNPLFCRESVSFVGLIQGLMLRPLKTKRAEEVAYPVLSIFLIFGTPAILQSDNGRKFSNQIISEICAMWKDVKIVHGKPPHSQTQGSV
ncbi:SCAN domain-containing protein 3 [Trichonephila clavipes]|nr:SCAN domain-containing protein 3 [Trichonephila clavipes]